MVHISLSSAFPLLSWDNSVVIVILLLHQFLSSPTMTIFSQFLKQFLKIFLQLSNTHLSLFIALHSHVIPSLSSTQCSPLSLNITFLGTSSLSSQINKTLLLYLPITPNSSLATFGIFVILYLIICNYLLIVSPPHRPQHYKNKD